MCDGLAGTDQRLANPHSAGFWHDKQMLQIHTTLPKLDLGKRAQCRIADTFTCMFSQQDTHPRAGSKNIACQRIKRHRRYITVVLCQCRNHSQKGCQIFGFGRSDMTQNFETISIHLTS